MSRTPTSPLPPAGQEARYGYRYVNKTTGETFMFVRHFGQGAESAAQLVKNAATGEILVRKVVMSLFRREPHLFSTPFRPRAPKEIEILQEIHSWPDMPGFPRYFSHCYSHEYQKAKVSSYPLAGTLYRHVGLWKLCNGGAVIRNSQVAPGGTLAIRMTDEIPMAALGRFTWQIIGSLHFLGHGNPTGVPVQHRDAHPGNIFMHWTNGPVDLDNPSSLLPDFILGDFGEAEFQPIDSVDKYRQPLTTDVERIQHTFRMCLEELGLLMMEKTSNGPVWRKLQGPHRSSFVRLLDVSDAIDAMVEQEKRAHNQPYPNLMPLVKMGKEIEAMCLSGGVDAGLMNGDAWKKFVGERRAQALAMSTAPPFTLRANREEALKPRHPSTGGRLELFAPWTLCVSAWKVVQEGPTPATDPNAGKYPDNKGYYTSDIVWDSLPVVEEDESQPIQDDEKKGRIFEKLFLLSAKTPRKIAEEGESFTVALDWHEPEGEDSNQWQPSLPRTAKTMPGRFPVTESSSEEPSEPSSKSVSSPGLSAFRNEDELEALYEELDALDSQFKSSGDEDDNNNNPKPPQFNPVAPVFIPKGPIEAENSEEKKKPQLQPEVPAFVLYGYTNGVDDYPQVTANIQLNKLLKLNNPDKVNNNPSEAIMRRLHRLVHPESCNCDNWYLDIEDRLEMIHLSSTENSRETSLKGSSKETPETNKGTESSPLTVPDKSILDEKTPVSPSPAAPSVGRQQPQQRRTRLPVPISARQKAAAATTPTRPPVAQIPSQTRTARPTGPIQRPTVPTRQVTRPTVPARVPTATRLAAATNNNRVAPAPRSPNVARTGGAFERRAAAAPAPAPRPGAVSRAAVRRDAGPGADKEKKSEKRPAWR